MQFDASASLAILDLKRKRLDTLATVADRHLWYDGLVRLMQWLLREPMLRAYVTQIADGYAAEERAVMSKIAAAPAKLAAAAKTFRLNSKSPSEASPWPPPLAWEAFDQSVARANAKECSAETYRSAVDTAAWILSAHAKAAVESMLRLSNESEASLQKAQREHEAATIAMEAAEVDDPSALNLWFARTKDVFESTKAHRGAALEQFEAECKIAKRLYRVTNPYAYTLKLWKHEETHSSRAALARLLRLCRGLPPPLEGVAHWTDVLDEDRLQGLAVSRALHANPEGCAPEAERDLARLVEELHVMGASSLSHGVVVERFAERCAWYDRDRMRKVAREGSGKREDRLTLELAKYMHDCGIFVLVRPRISNLEPDVVALRGLAVEAKAYTSSANARRELIDGYYQLHAYMTSLETRALPAREGFLVAFRLGGPIYESPRTIKIGRFLIHSLTIDLGVAADSGRKQPRPQPVSEAEILEGVTKRRNRR